MTPIERLTQLASINGAFSPIVPGLQTFWDSTSLGLLKQCPYKYYLSMVEGWRSKIESHHLTFGILYHQCLELYDRLLVDGKSKEEAIRATVRKALCGSGQRDSEGKFHPWIVDQKMAMKSREIFVRTVIWHIETFDTSKEEICIRDDGKPMVELSFKFDAGLRFGSSGESVVLCGHLDKIVRFSEAVWIKDYKTTKTTLSSDYFAKYTPDNQMSMYSLAGQVVFGQPLAGVIVDAVQLALGFSRFQQGFAHRTPGMIEEWLEDTKEWIKRAETYALAGYWPMNDTACNLYGKCVFRDSVCSKDPSVRLQFLEGHFQRQVWDPTITREP